jgi:FlaA1/EpsC-like NDP-sugar epimerase
MDSDWAGQKIAITGVAGTIGKELLRQLEILDPIEIIGIDNNEGELFYLNELCRNNSKIRLYLGDIRDRESLAERLYGCDVVLHLAALKHVGLCEQSPRQAIQTNILGTQNVIDAAAQARVKRVVLTSSDKAVNPTNVMGTSKLMAERLMTAADAVRQDEGPVYGSVRFGNVMGSRGSVIPLFHRQIMSGGPVTLTHPDMSRFIMSLENAVQLVLGAASRLRGGEVLVTKMPVIKIQDLAEVMIEELAPVVGRLPRDIAIEVVGSRAGEKMFEELMNDEEAGHAVEAGQYLIIHPRLRTAIPLPSKRNADRLHFTEDSQDVSKAYNSAIMPPMSREALRFFLREHNLLSQGG